MRLYVPEAARVACMHDLLSNHMWNLIIAICGYMWLSIFKDICMGVKTT